MKKNNKFHGLFLTALGDSIRYRRVELLLSQEKLATSAKLHRSYVTEVENGMRNISITTLLKIAKALKSNPSSHMIAAESVFDSEDK